MTLRESPHFHDRSALELVAPQPVPERGIYPVPFAAYLYPVPCVAAVPRPSDDVPNGDAVLPAKDIECGRNGCTVAASVFEYVPCRLYVWYVCGPLAVPINLSDLLTVCTLVPLCLALVVAGFVDDGLVKVGLDYEVVSIVLIRNGHILLFKQI